MYKKIMISIVCALSITMAQDISEELYEKGMNGDLDAMVAIGKIYADEREKEDAKIWLRRAALQNHPEAQYLMAIQLRFDDEEAYEEWLQRSVAQNYAPAQVEMAEHYFDQRTEEYDQKGLKLLEAAALQNDAKALMILGQNYILGMYGLKADPKKGKAYLEKSVAQGSMGAAYYIGRYYMSAGSEQNYTEALQWFQRVINESNEKSYTARLANTEIANMYILGLGVPKDIDKAKEILTPIVSRYMPTTVYNMGLIYAQSDDETERKKSLGYLRKACWEQIQASCDKVQEILGAQNEK